jgi:hypothetical protein
MAFHQMHLHKSGAGMSSRTACGRNTMRTPLSCGWEGFKLTPQEQQCERCASSKQAELNQRRDLDAWVPESPDAWKIADDKLVASRKAA